MKRFICFVIAMVMLLSTAQITIWATERSSDVTSAGGYDENIVQSLSYKGDINGDGVSDQDDLYILSRHVAKIQSITDANMLAMADINGDNEINAFDMSALSEIIESTENGSFDINDIKVDKGEAYVGSLVEWDVMVEGCTDNVNYRYDLYKNGSFLNSQNYTERDYYCTVLNEPGSYDLVVTCKNEEGIVKSLSSHDSVMIYNRELEIISIKSDADIAYTGDNICWTVSYAYGQPPYMFSYRLFCNGMLVDSRENVEESCYSFDPMVEGEYQLEACCKDSNGDIKTLMGDGVVVSSLTNVKPNVPILQFEDGFPVFSMDESNPIVYEPTTIDIHWNPVEKAESYIVTLDKNVGNKWENIAYESDIISCYYKIPKTLLDNCQDNTLFRFTICSQGIVCSDVSAYYFTVSEKQDDVSNELLVDGKKEFEWNQAHRYESGVRSFKVTSDLPWTVTASEDWVVVSKTQDGFTAVISEMGIPASRSAEITVDNGSSQAIISVYQDTAETAPKLYVPNIDENTIDNPVIYPIGDIVAQWTNKDDAFGRCLFRIFEKTNVGYELIYEKITNANYVALNASIFKAGGLYAFEITGCYSYTLTDEVLSDSLKSVYYLKMIDSGYDISVNGEKAIVVSDEADSTIACYVSATNLWNAKSDVDWIELSTDKGSRNSSDVKLYTSPNLTSEKREGHVTFTCGSAEAKVTVVQNASIPEVLTPNSLSTVLKSPTMLDLDAGNRLTDDELILIYFGESLSIAKYSNGSFIDETVLGTNSVPEIGEVWLNNQTVSTRYTYRLTVKIGSQAKHYYVKFTGDESAYPILFKRMAYRSFDVNRAGGETSVIVSATESWSANCGASWVTLSQNKGSSGSKEITIRVSENSTGVPRSARISFNANKSKYTIYYDIYQTAYDNITVVRADTGTCGALENLNMPGYETKTEKYKIYSCGSISVVSNAAWIRFNKKMSSDSESLDSGDSLVLYCAENTSGSIRKGTVTLTCGSVQKTISVTQVPGITSVGFAAPTLSTSKTNPSVLKHEDLSLTWESDPNAVAYEVFLNGYDDIYSYEIKAESMNSLTVSMDRIIPIADKTYYLKLSAYDRYGYRYVSEIYYFKITDKGCALLNGSADPVWEYASDFNAVKDFTVQSSGNWTAKSDQSWVSLSKSSGASGDTLTVSLANNDTDSARQAKVYVSVGGNETVLNITQWGIIPEFPSFAMPEFSDDEANPTILASGTEEITVSWESEPQVEHRVTLYEFSSGSAGRVVSESSKIKCGVDSYTFKNLQLVPGQLYWFGLSRESERWGRTGTRGCYFTVLDENAFVKINGNESAYYEFDFCEDSVYCTITSSGCWTASTDDDWLMVYKRPVDSKDLAEESEMPSDYNRFTGESGADLCISALENLTGSVRTGHVSLVCGSARIVVELCQYQSYVTAKLITPLLSTTSADIRTLRYGDVNLTWSEAQNGFGYSVTLYESEEPRRGYYKIYQKDRLSSLNHTIPADKLTEGMYYKLYLGTMVNNNPDDAAVQSYYFRYGYENELTAYISCDWSRLNDGYIPFDVSASGGGGEYLYAFSLYKNDNMIQETEYSRQASYSFHLTETGNYKVRVVVKDKNGDVAEAYSTHRVESSAFDLIEISESKFEFNGAGGKAEVNLNASGDFVLTDKPSWVTVSSTSGSKTEKITISVDSTNMSRSGMIKFKCGTASAVIEITQFANDISETVITYPSNGTVVAHTDLKVKWNNSPSADYSMYSLRDLTSDVLTHYHVKVENTSAATIPAYCLIQGHRYRIAVGTVYSNNGEEYVKWCEREFVVESSSTNATELNGFVTSSLGNPIADANVFVYSGDEQYRIAQVKTDKHGFWKISGLQRGQSYLLQISASCYEFEQESISVQTNAAIQEINTVAINYFDLELDELPFRIQTNEIDFSADAESSEIYITAENGWYAEVDCEWLTLSQYSGETSGYVTITASQNIGKNNNYSDRTGTITFYERMPESPKRYSANTMSLYGGRGNSQTLSATQDKEQKYVSPSETQSDEIFNYVWLFADTYNGNQLKEYYSYTNDSDIKIDRDMVIPAGTTVKAKNIEICAQVTFESKKDEDGTIITGTLEASGNIKVKSDGKLDMRRGGKLVSKGNFVFDSKHNHEYYLTGGVIEVGGDIEIKRNFFADHNNSFYIIASNDNSVASRKINMWRLKGDKQQHFGNLYMNDVGIDVLDVKETFKCSGEMKISNWNYLAVGNELNFFELTNSRSKELLPRNLVQVALFKMLTDGRVSDLKDTNDFISWMSRIAVADKEETYQYCDENGKLHVYTVKFQGSALNAAATSGTATIYLDGKKYTYIVGPTNIDVINNAVETCYKVIKKFAKDQLKDEYRDLCKGIINDSVSQLLPEDLKNPEKLSEYLKKNRKELARKYKLLEK